MSRRVAHMLSLFAIWGCLSEAKTQNLQILGGSGNAGEVDKYSEACTTPHTGACIGSGGCLAAKCQTYASCTAADATWGPAYQFTGHPWGLVGPTKTWINYKPGGGTVAETLYTETYYRIRFQAPLEFSDIKVEFQIISDNYASMWLNGEKFAPNAAWGGGGKSPVMALSSGVKPGLNEVFLMMGDCGGWVGFNYFINITITSEEKMVIGEAGDECIQCSPQATCDKTASPVACVCNAGFSGDGKTCADINECTAGTATCGANSVCSNTAGSYACPCSAGFSGDGKTNTCAAISCASTGYTGSAGACECDVGYSGTVAYANGAPTGCQKCTSQSNCAVDAAACLSGKTQLACTTPASKYEVNAGVVGPALCSQPSDLTGYTVSAQANLNAPSLDVTVACASGYSGTASATACTSAGPYSLAGCTGISCAPTGYKGTAGACTCDFGYAGTVTYESGTPKGCSPSCVHPSDVTGYIIQDNNLFAATFDVKATCASGFTGTGKATACATSGPYTLSGCTGIACTGDAYTGTAGACKCATGYTGTVTYTGGTLGGCQAFSCSTLTLPKGYLELAPGLNTYAAERVISCDTSNDHEGESFVVTCTIDGWRLKTDSSTLDWTECVDKSAAAIGADGAHFSAAAHLGGVSPLALLAAALAVLV